MSASPEAIVPGKVLVFEVIGPIGDFARALTELGFDWLAEADAAQDDDDFEEVDDEVVPEDSEGRDVAGRLAETDAHPELLYLSMPSEAALRQLLVLWTAFARGQKPGRGQGPWWALFGYLSDLRTWSTRDRIEAAVALHLRRMSEGRAGDAVRFELDLWFRGTPDARSAALEQVQETVSSIGGRVLDRVIIEPIRYLAMLVDLPVAEAIRLAELDGPLATAAAVMSVRPQSTFRAPGPEANEEPGEPVEASDDEPDQRPPIVALLDGYPVADHFLLANRLDVSEVDVLGRLVPVDRRHHGTAMASLILHGDLAAGEPALRRTLKVVPILGAGQGAATEGPPSDRLALGLVHRAVMSMLEGVDGADPTAPKVVLLNHSVCDEQAPFRRRPSAWAKLLDHLSFAYRLLFVVSAGNRMEAIYLPAYPDREAFLNDDPVDRQNAILLALELAKQDRSLFSPAEGVNVLTVGALHGDAAGDCPADQVDPFLVPGLTAMCSGVGPGANRSVKPDMVELGGRLVANAAVMDGRLKVWGRSIGQLGQEAASPDRDTGTLDRTRRLSGTSGAAALVTRMGVGVADAVEAVFAEDNVDWMALSTRAVILKALMAHGCGWAPISGELVAAFPPPGSRRDKAQDTVTRLVGNGQPNPGKVISGSSRRITLLAEDGLSHDGLHEYRLPIPNALIRCPELRRITITLAWATPIDPATLAYRGIAMQLRDAGNKRAFWRGAAGVRQPKAATQMRGTLVHRVMEGSTAVRKAVNGGMFVGVQARAVSSQFESIVAPYALAISLEVGASVATDIYAEVKSLIRPAIATPVRVRQRV